MGRIRAQLAQLGDAIDEQPCCEQDPRERRLVGERHRDVRVMTVGMLDQHPGTDHVAI